MQSKIMKLATVAGLALLTFVISACRELEKPKTKEFYSKTIPPRMQEFRWSNGGKVASIDPARASAPPETDVVRALFEGLTQTDASGLDAAPGVATEWSADADSRVWTFRLNKNAKWSNGENVVAGDFVESWKRVVSLGSAAPSYRLMTNIEGVQPLVVEPDAPRTTEPLQSSQPASASANVGIESLDATTPNSIQNPNTKPEPKADETLEIVPAVTQKSPNSVKQETFGVIANGDHELVIRLRQPDKQFPTLVANPVFLPVYDKGRDFADSQLPNEVITNGSFRLGKIDHTGITLESSKSYWDFQNVKLKRVKFVSMTDPDSALRAYRNGELDAVTNADFSPLALKLLTPYNDFKRIPHGALNMYEFNLKNEPFNDRRVREALAISIDRQQLTRDEMDGATTAAERYLPFEDQETGSKLGWNPEKARDLLIQAGYENGENFPRVKLVINRNNVQEKIAKSVTEMWNRELGIESEIVIKDSAGIAEVKKTGDYDVLRKNVVLPTTDETANMLAIFNPSKPVEKPKNFVGSGNAIMTPESKSISENAFNSNVSSEKQGSANDSNVVSNSNGDELLIDLGEEILILTEADALNQVPGIPIYFPTSYSLVKPYVEGFEMNVIDAPSLKTVFINSNWKDDGVRD